VSTTRLINTGQRR